MTRSADWDAILASSSSIIEAAREARWSEVAELHQERHRRLERFFADYAVTDMATTIAEGIDQILRADHQLEALMKDDRIRMSDEMSQSKANARAMQSYADAP